ncbi:MAG: FERM domain-containing protein 7 [Paramarteilia canceri]
MRNLSVVALDGTAFTYEIQPEIRASEVWRKVQKDANISEPQYFGLEFVHPKSGFKWLELQKPICEQLFDYKLQISVQFFPKDQFKLMNNYTRYLMALHVRHLFFEQSQKCFDGSRIKLLSLFLSLSYPGYDLNQYIKLSLNFINDACFSDFYDKVLVCCTDLVKSDKISLSFQIIELILKLYYYQSRTRICWIKVDGILYTVSIGLTHLGISIFEDEKPIYSFDYPDIKGLNINGVMVCLTLYENEDTFSISFENNQIAEDFKLNIMSALEFYDSGQIHKSRSMSFFLRPFTGQKRMTSSQSSFDANGCDMDFNETPWNHLLSPLIVDSRLTANPLISVSKTKPYQTPNRLKKLLLAAMICRHESHKIELISKNRPYLHQGLSFDSLKNNESLYSSNLTTIEKISSADLNNEINNEFEIKKILAKEFTDNSNFYEPPTLESISNVRQTKSSESFAQINVKVLESKSTKDTISSKNDESLSSESKFPKRNAEILSDAAKCMISKDVINKSPKKKLIRLVSGLISNSVNLDLKHTSELFKEWTFSSNIYITFYSFINESLSFALAKENPCKFQHWFESSFSAHMAVLNKFDKFLAKTNETLKNLPDPGLISETLQTYQQLIMSSIKYLKSLDAGIRYSFNFIIRN